MDGVRSICGTAGQIGSSPWIYAVAGVVFFTIYALVLQPLFFSKLRSFPGPAVAKVSSFWLTQQCRHTRRSEAVLGLHRKYGDFVRIAPNNISINDPAAVQQIYSHKSNFAKGDFYDAFLQVRPVVFNARNMVTHQKKRKYMNPAFSARALSEFEPYMDTEILSWKQQLLAMTEQTKSANVDFSVWTNFLAFDVIGSFAFGKSFGFIKSGKDSYNLIWTIITRGEVFNALGTVPVWLRPYMKYNYLDTFWSSGLRSTANLVKIGRSAYSDRKNSKDNRKDFLSFLFNAKDADTKENIPEEEIVAESISFIVGGSDTTSSTMTNFIDIISRDRTLQSQIQRELDQAFPNVQDEDWVAPDSIAGTLPLLNATLKEVMRVRPTSATGLERVVPPGGRVISGKFIPEGTTVSVPTCGVLRDERVFKDPERFDPQRWLAEDASALNEYFLPFSTGPRACIGRNFAWMEIVKTLATLLRLFEVERTTKDPTVIREGFFNKAAECNVLMKRRLLVGQAVAEKS